MSEENVYKPFDLAPCAILHSVPELEKQVKELNSILRMMYEKLPDAQVERALKKDRERIWELLTHTDHNAPTEVFCDGLWTELPVEDLRKVIFGEEK